MSCERGAVSLERTGIMVVAAILVGALLLVFTQGTPVAPKVREAVCIILNLGQGECGAGDDQALEPKPEPTDPCTVGESSVSREQKVAVIVVTGSNGKQLAIETLSDGTYRVTANEGEGVGLETGVGGGLSVTVADQRMGGTAQAGIGTELTMKNGEVYNIKNAEDLKSFTEAYLADDVKDGLVGDDNPLRWITDQVTNGTGLTKSLPTADETFTEGGFSTNASAEATAGFDSARAGVTGARALGIKTSKNGDRTFYMSTEVEGEAGLTSLGIDTSGPQFKGATLDGKMTIITAVTFDSNGNMTQVDATAMAAGEGSGLGSAAFTGDPTLAVSDSAGKAVVYQASLPTPDAASTSIGRDFLISQGVQQLGPMTFTGPTSSDVNYFDAARRDGTVTQQTYDYKGSTPFAVDASGKLGIELGVSANVQTSEMSITDAQYFDGTGMAPWTSCTAGVR